MSSARDWEGADYIDGMDDGRMEGGMAGVHPTVLDNRPFTTLPDLTTTGGICVASKRSILRSLLVKDAANI